MTAAFHSTFGRAFKLCVLFAFAATTLRANAADSIPPAPANYFNDFAGVTRPGTRQQLERELEQFEREQSSQIVVAIFRKIPDGAALEDFTYRTATAWKVGRKGLDNGAVLFVFVEDRKMRVEVGYGLEGAIPDAIAKRITSEEIKPYFQRGDYDGGIIAGTHALMKAARGEYKGSGKTVAQSRGRGTGVPWPVLIFIALFILIAASSFGRRRRGTTYGRRGRSGWGGWPIISTGGGGGGWSGGGSSGGGFSGGGGSFGGGGASDSW
jgi:uncharacterized protein